MISYRDLGLYLHIPYCAAKCFYCDFNSYEGSTEAEHEAFVAALLKEMAMWRGRLDRPFTTLFVGGGTPSLLSGPLLAQVIQTALTSFDFVAEPEVTVEANPGTIDFADNKLTLIREAGANRLSFGVQAVQDPLLQRLGRIHTLAEVEAAIEAARAAGFENLNLDLMYGLPGQTLADWQETLRAAIAWGPEHVSAYSLIVEPGTPFYDWRRVGQLPLPLEDEEDEMHNLAVSLLTEAGYEQYEISNYARPGFRSKHNQIYWHNGPYLGLGPGAHSYLAGRRFWNIRPPKQYINRLEQGQSPETGGEVLDRPGQMAETMMMGLRLLDGVAEAEFEARFGQPLRSVYGPALERLTEQGLLEFAAGSWRLTPRGLRVGNYVWQQFLP